MAYECECKKKRIVADAYTNRLYCPIVHGICDMDVCAMSISRGKRQDSKCLVVLALESIANGGLK